MADAPFSPSDYTGLITSEHRGKARFVETVSVTATPVADEQAFLAGLPDVFDLDTAIGVQLDAVGAWAGISRVISIPLINVWFSWGIAGRGWGQGIWKGPYDPETGIYELDDDTYRSLIRLKIKVNNWDGLLETASEAIEAFYASEGSYPFILDNQNMSMTVCISGARPPAIMFAIFAGRYVEFKPAGVRILNVVPSVPNTPAFGFGVDNEYIAGWGTGSWVRDAEEAMIEELSPDPGVQYDEPIFPIDLQAKRTSFGDIRMSFNPNQDTTNKTFFVDVYDTGGTNVLRTLTLSSPELVDGRVNADYPIEWNSVDFGFPPTYLVFAVRVGQSDAVGTIVASIEVDNTIVKKAYMFGGQSNALGHFTTLSGATLGEGSAAAFRRSVAAALGLSWIEVMPVQLCWGSSAADVWADDDPVYGENWWYDIDNDEPGPRLTESISALDDLGIPIAGIIWAQGENDASAMNPTSAPRHSTPDRYKTATEKIFAALRAATSSDMPIWIQTCGRGFWGDPPDPPEAGGEYYKAVRDKQVAIAAAQPYTYIGSWVPGCETIAGYVPEVGNPGWVHYTASVYMATAAELAEAVTTPLDRINSRPAWTLLVAPVLTPSVTGFNVRVTWAAGNGATYVVTNLDVVDGTTISETEVSESDGQCNWYFTGAEQVAHYGYAGGYVNVIVYQTKDGVRGPASQLVFNASDLPGYADAPSGLAVAHGSGWDLVYSWDAEPGASYTVVNRNVGDNSVLSTEVVEGDTWTFTGASQISVYGTPAGYVYFEVQKMFDGVPGPAASKTQDISLLSGNPMTAPTGIDAHKSGNDIVVDWDGGGSETFRVRNISVVDSGVISSDVVVGPSWTFDEADQVYEYGFATNYIAVYVARIADGYPGPETYYSKDLS